MKIATILDHIDSGHMALPEFQRGFVWNRDQVRGLMASLYQRHPVGSLLVWVTQSAGANTRGDGGLAPGVVKLLLDGQQRITTLYGIARGRPPRFFDGNPDVFKDLYFHLADEEFSFYQPVKMKDNPLWVDVSALIRGGNDGLGAHYGRFDAHPELKANAGTYVGRLSRVLGILDIKLHTDEVTGDEKTLDVVVDIFNRVNSGGTKLSKGDLALAKICADWPEARDRMKQAIARWRESGYEFNLDWLLRSVNTILTGEAKFHYLHSASAEEVQRGVVQAERHIDTLLNLIAGRLGLDHGRVLFGRYAFPVMTHYLERRGGAPIDQVEQDRLLFWYLQSAMWGRFSGTTESTIDKDLAALENLDDGLDRLIHELCLSQGRLTVQPDHFGGWSLGARFYPVLYLLTRIGEARDWGLGIPLKHSLLGKMSRLEVHHIFPKAKLYKAGFVRAQVNALANYCFQTKDTNIRLGSRLPQKYFPEIEAKHPGALASQWIPADPDLWRIEYYLEFLEERKRLLAEQTNQLLRELYHGELPTPSVPEALQPESPVHVEIPGGIESEEEEQLLRDLNDWVASQGLPRGEMSYELMHPGNGEAVAVLDLAWPEGLQVGLSEPVAVLLNEGPELLKIANELGFKHFTDVENFRLHVRRNVLAQVGDQGSWS